MSKRNVNLQANAELISAPRFKGYTIDQVRYQLVYQSLQREFCKERMINNFKRTLNSTPFGTSGKSRGGMMGIGLLGPLLKGLSYADYIIAGFSAFKTVKSIFSIFRKKKK